MGEGKYAVVLARVAEQDLVAIIEFIALEDPMAANHVLDRMEKRIESRARQPGRGRVVPELGALGLRTHREMVVDPWRLVYRISEKTVYVVAIFDGRRNLQDVLLERALRMTE
jgi:plasmid stabilization system protein ParE